MCAPRCSPRAAIPPDPAGARRGRDILLSASGWRAPAIAQHLGDSAATVRTVRKGFPQTGLAGLRRQHPGPPRGLYRREQVTAALDRLLAQPRTWTAAQLTVALAEEGIQLSTRQTRRYLQQLGARWRRTARSLRHEQAPVRVERTKEVLEHPKKIIGGPAPTRFPR